jgi:hypothetical protein
MPTVIEEEHPTGELRTDATAQVPVVASGDAGSGSDEIDALFDGEDDAWPTEGPAKGFRVPWLAAGLLALLIAFGGLWGGAYLQRHSSSSSTASGSPFGGSFPFSIPGGAGAARTPAGGTSGFPGTSSAASGTVTDIIGNTLYVTDASGNLVAVNVGSTTTVNRNAKSSLGSLQPGDTVSVQGTKSKDGTVTASSVSATQSGVTSSGGFPGFGGGAGAGASGTPSGA